MSMRAVSEHQQVVADLIRATSPTPVCLGEAAGRVLAEDYYAQRSLPGFDNSAMDGYAVYAADTTSATRTHPVALPVTDDIPAGRTDVPPLAPGTAHRIMTGALMPAGADAVVQVEATDGGTDVVAIYEPREARTHVRPVGIDVQAGQSVLTKGTVLGPAQLGLLAALGATNIEVRPALRVLIMSTGSELAEPGTLLKPGQIYDANSIMLTAAVHAAGARAEHVHSVPDDTRDFHAAIAPWLDKVDLVLTSGGVSAGAYEVVKDALSERGIDFAKVAMQPGMPQGAGMLDRTPIVTLPGNPVSSLVSFEVFVRPAIRAAMGYPDPHRPVVRAQLTEPLTSPAGKRQFRRGRLDKTRGQVDLVGPAGSHFLRSLALANCLIDIPAETTRLDHDSTVDVWLIQ